MTEESIPVWREALTNRDHDLYRVAWSVFMKSAVASVTAKRFEEEKETVIPFLVSIIEDDDLYESQNLGDALAPIMAAQILREWNAHETLGVLLQALADTGPYESFYKPFLTTIQGFGDVIVDDVIAWAEENEEYNTIAANILSVAAQNNDTAYDKVLSWIEPDELDLEDFAQWLIEINAERAGADLRALSNNHEFEKADRKVFRDKSSEANKLARRLKKEAKQAEETAKLAEAEAEAQAEVEVEAETETETE